MRNSPLCVKYIVTKVKTPIGEGVSQGRFVTRQEDESIPGVLVRLPVNDVTRAHLSQSYCLTPRAQASALFVFSESELR